ncbi:MAG: hypothetical protein EKK48_14130 [Candidatus Melainabacteria bacterium]|nr:MAG: hypothetical protein EKK48_14130 [Candidatus Melainabacteria bacterium]
MITTTGSAQSIAVEAQGPISYAGGSALIILELNKRAAFRRRLMFRDGRLDFFEVSQLVRYLQSVQSRTAEQDTQLHIVRWLKAQRQSGALSGDIMMSQICKDSNLPRYFEPTAYRRLNTVELGEMWNEAKQQSNNNIHVAKTGASEDTKTVEKITLAEPKQSEKSTSQDISTTAMILQQRKAALLDCARSSLQANGNTAPNAAQVFDEMMRIMTNSK